MTEFNTPVDIADRCLQHLGSDRIDSALGFTEDSIRASETAFAYPKLRVAELQRNVWEFAIKNAVLRAIDSNTMLLVPAMWVQTTTYFVGSIVSDEDGNAWISVEASNLGNDPQNSTMWQPYFGPMSVSLWDSSTSYLTGELVYTAAGDGTSRVYLSLVSDNSDNPATATAWDSTVTYKRNDVVTYSSVAYMSLVDLNLNTTPNVSPSQWTTSFVGGAGSIKWRQIGGTEFPTGVGLTTINLTYPINTGPTTQEGARNYFRLPNNFMRRAPRDPKAGSISYLGAESGLPYDDWRFIGNYLISRDAMPIILYFIADVIDVRLMDAMFCEGLAARMAFELCEKLTQSTTKQQLLMRAYEDFMTDARTVNAILTGVEEQPIDDWIGCRV